jgi:hypothetical protein
VLAVAGSIGTVNAETDTVIFGAHCQVSIATVLNSLNEVHSWLCLYSPPKALVKAKPPSGLPSPVHEWGYCQHGRSNTYIKLSSVVASRDVHTGELQLALVDRQTYITSTADLNVGDVVAFDLDKVGGVDSALGDKTSSIAVVQAVSG